MQAGRKNRSDRLALESGAAERRYRAAAEDLGFLGMFAGLDMPGPSTLTRQRLGWQPQEIGLIADTEANYFAD